jgi:uncharacterized lipoprotein YddW (UPF0748 family)
LLPMLKKITISILTIFLLFTATAQQKEFRAAWIATVDNIDWPTKGNWDAESQKAEFIKIIDMHKRNGLNALVVQIRPATDAFYPSPYEPWSQFLTGKQGAPPQPYYDPLQFMVDECHKRGFEFHAWMNPYRAVFNTKQSKQSPTHITKIHPEWFVTYGDHRYFDPGNKEAQKFVNKVVEDVVKRYNIDAIHFDDYFYPYKLPRKDFPDAKTFKQYGNGLLRDDWRRSNCDSIIATLSRTIKRVNPKCKFGISPFGIWRNSNKDSINGSNTNGGSSNYDDLYADILLWLKNDWIDYVAPQLYWEFEHKIAPYQTLLDWWNEHTYGKHLYIGLAIYRAGSNENWKDSTQLPRQIEALREKKNVKGMIFFSSKSFNNNPNGWSDELRYNYFKDPAIIPEMEWLKK